MTIDVPIRPNAALADSETYHYVEDNILNAEYDFVTRRSYIPDRAYNKEGVLNVLANYPWVRYGYKVGHWHRQPMFYELSFLPLKEWAQHSKPLLLIDETTGDELGEMTSIAGLADGPSGELLFAGDPHYAGVIKSVKAGEPYMTIVGAIRLDPSCVDGCALGHTTIAKHARDLTKSMVPGQTPQVPLHDLPENYLKYRGPWIADHSKKPPRKWKPEGKDYPDA